MSTTNGAQLWDSADQGAVALQGPVNIPPMGNSATRHVLVISTAPSVRKTPYPTRGRRSKHTSAGRSPYHRPIAPHPSRVAPIAPAIPHVFFTTLEVGGQLDACLVLADAMGRDCPAWEKAPFQGTGCRMACSFCIEVHSLSSLHNCQVSLSGRCSCGNYCVQNVVAEKCFLKSFRVAL